MAPKMFLNRKTCPANKGKGVPHIDDKGYIRVYFNGRHVKHHRLVMEQHLKRKLLPTECVHHINHIKTDNRIENLQIVTASEHRKLHLVRMVKNTITGEVYDSVKSAAKDLNVTVNRISAMLSGRVKNKLPVQYIYKN